MSTSRRHRTAAARPAEGQDDRRERWEHHRDHHHDPRRHVDAAPTILPEIPTRLGEYAARQLTGRGIDIRVGTTLESVDEDSLVLRRLRAEEALMVEVGKIAPRLSLVDELGREVELPAREAPTVLVFYRGDW